MNKQIFTNDNKASELSLEELDIIYRKCHQLHDEEVLRIVGRFFRRLADFLDAGGRQLHHSSHKLELRS